MMNTKFKFFAFFTASAVAFAIVVFNKCSCGRHSELTGQRKDAVAIVKANFINPLYSSMNVGYSEYTIYAGKDTVIYHPSGSKIYIPSCAFLNHGEEVKGYVKVKYREMMDKADIVASGIPMSVNPGSNNYLETAGMMEFAAFKGDQILEPSPSCKVKFEMVNTTAVNDINLYYLDTNAGSWLTILKNLPAHIFQKTVSKKYTKKAPEGNFQWSEKETSVYFIPLKPKVANPSRFGFHFKIDLSKYPEVNVYDGIIWEYAGKGGEDDPKKDPWVEKAQWKDMYLYKTDNKEVFKLKLVSRDKAFETIVRPVFEKEDMEYAMDIFNDRYSKYRKFADQKKEEERKWKVEQMRFLNVKEKLDMITRTFEIDKFGIWNCDRMKTLDQPIVMALRFSTKADSVKIERAYLIDESVNSVFYYAVNMNAIEVFKLEKNKNYKMILLDSQAKIHTVSEKDISGFYKSQTSSTLIIKDEGKFIKSMNELKNLI